MRIFNLSRAVRPRLRAVMAFGRKKGLPVDNAWVRIVIIASAVIVVCGLVIIIFGLAATAPRASTADHKNQSKQKTGKTQQPSKSASSAPQPQVPGAPAAPNPSSVLNLANWKLTLPTRSSGSKSPDEIQQPQLAGFSETPYFYVNDAHNGVVFQAPVGGATTSGSAFPRSELREMTNGGSQEASWSTTSGTNTMIITEAITHLPVARPQLVAGQIHGPSSYVILIRLNGSTLFVEYNGKNIGTLNADYALGTPFTVEVTASNGLIQVFYNGVQKASQAQKGSGYYFKAGCYTQSNPSDGDSPSAYGQVVIYGLQVTHS